MLSNAAGVLCPSNRSRLQSVPWCRSEFGFLIHKLCLITFKIRWLFFGRFVVFMYIDLPDPAKSWVFGFVFFFCLEHQCAD